MSDAETSSPGVQIIRRSKMRIDDELLGTSPDANEISRATPDKLINIKKSRYVIVIERLTLGEDIAFLLPVGAGGARGDCKS